MKQNCFKNHQISWSNYNAMLAQEARYQAPFKGLCGHCKTSILPMPKKAIIVFLVKAISLLLGNCAEIPLKGAFLWSFWVHSWGKFCDNSRYLPWAKKYTTQIRRHAHYHGVVIFYCPCHIRPLSAPAFAISGTHNVSVVVATPSIWCQQC